MREIKFRAFVPKEGMIEIGVLELDRQKGHDYYNFYDAYAGTTAYFNVDNGESEKSFLMQYTGLKDKNGKEIYHMDIIHSLYSDGSPCRHVVKWVDTDARFMIYDLKTDRECGGISNNWIHENNKEVIGNIYQNPELL